MLKKSILLLSIFTIFSVPTEAKERRIYSTNQGITSEEFNLDQLYGTWVRADDAKAHKNEFVIITPANPTYIQKGLEFFSKKDAEYREQTDGSRNPFSSLMSLYKDLERQSKRLVRLRAETDVLEELDENERRNLTVAQKAINEELGVSRVAMGDPDIYAGDMLAFFRYEIKSSSKARTGGLVGGSATIANDYKASESLPSRVGSINYEDAIKINKEKYNFDIVGETDYSMLLNNDVNYHFYDIVRDDMFIVYRDDGTPLHAYKRAKVQYELPFHRQFELMSNAVGLKNQQ